METRRSGDTTEIIMTGTISERTNLSAPPEPGTSIEIDASAVRRINSMGVAAWLKFMQALEEMKIPVGLKLSPVLVSQASMISSFLGPAKVLSFKAPYYCHSCDYGGEVTFGTDDEVPDNLPCAECEAEMEFDEDKKSFLAFRQDN